MRPAPTARRLDEMDLRGSPRIAVLLAMQLVVCGVKGPPKPPVPEFAVGVGERGGERGGVGAGAGGDVGGCEGAAR
jgi:hypothetical protein